MTEFGGLEQEMLKVMVQLFESKNLSVYNWLSKLFDNKISFKGVHSGNPAECRIEIRQNGFEESEIFSKINDLYFLIFRLESAFLIKVNEYEEINHDEINKMETYNINSQDLKRTKMYGFLSYYRNHPIQVSNYLIELVENDFKSPEQRRFEKQIEVTNANHNVAMDKARKQINIAWGAFGVSLITLIISFVFGIWEKCSETKIDQSQLNQIKQSIEQKTLPDVIKTKITNDTLTTKVVEMPKDKPNR